MRHLPTIVFVISLMFLAFVGGAVMTVSETYPAPLIRDAYRGGMALYDKLTRYTDPYTTDLWSKQRTEDRGVTRHLPDKARAGLTLYTSGHAAKATLVDMNGEPVHEWERPFSSIWDASAATDDPVSDHQIYFRKAHVFPNGDLLALYEGVGDTPYGYGMARLDVDSSLLWKNLDNLHHDFDVADDGHIAALAHGVRTTGLKGADQFEPPFLEDSLVILSPKGKTLTKFSLLEAINDSDYRRYLWRVPYYSLADPLHANGVDYLDRDDAERLARKIPEAAPGQVLVSFRELAGGSVALVDVEAETVVWASRGPWLAQHDPDILPNGNLLVFDNRGHFGAGGKSRIVEVDPATGAIEWVYAGDENAPLESLIRAAVERQSNGNTLITESSGGRLLEVTTAGEIVWEYVNPIRGGEANARIPVISYGQRIPPDRLSAPFRARIAPTTTAREEHTP
ncbi:arylsulfotransferase family protein [Arhodomonas sp. AD133]|uniref:arylsulfotransferase family protein n=1 Tax=Arhodomonas sp. AD133 TaxID=3415009 RepID=UPI003EBB9A6D